MDSKEQQEFILKYVSKLSRLEKYGLVFERFSEHEYFQTKTKSIKVVTGCYFVRDNADFTNIEKQLKIFNLHEYFVILALI